MLDSFCAIYAASRIRSLRSIKNTNLLRILLLVITLPDLHPKAADRTAMEQWQGCGAETSSGTHNKETNKTNKQTKINGLVQFVYLTHLPHHQRYLTSVRISHTPSWYLTLPIPTTLTQQTKQASGTQAHPQLNHAQYPAFGMAQLLLNIKRGFLTTNK